MNNHRPRKHLSITLFILSFVFFLEIVLLAMDLQRVSKIPEGSEIPAVDIVLSALLFVSLFIIALSVITLFIIRLTLNHKEKKIIIARDANRAKPLSSIVCPNCSTTNATTNKFCSNCGTELPEVEKEQPLLKKETSVKTRYPIRVKMYLYSNPLLFTGLILSLFVFCPWIIGYMVYTKFFGPLFDIMIFVACFLLFILLLQFVIVPLLQKKNIKKHDIKAEIEIYKDRLVYTTTLSSKETKGSMNTVINGNSNLTNYFEDFYKAKETKDGFYFVRLNTKMQEVCIFESIDKYTPKEMIDILREQVDIINNRK